MPLVGAMAVRLKPADRRSCCSLRKQVNESVFGLIKQAETLSVPDTCVLSGWVDRHAMICAAQNLNELAQAGHRALGPGPVHAHLSQQHDLRTCHLDSFQIFCGNTPVRFRR